MADEITTILGDSMTEMRKIGDCSIDAIITDPPYGIDFQSSRTGKNERKTKIANDGKEFIWWLFDAYRVLSDNSGLVCFSRWDIQSTFVSAMELAGFVVKNIVVWDKKTHGLGDLRGAFAPSYGTAIFAVKGKLDIFEISGARYDDIVRVPAVNPQKLIHPNEKPVGLYEHFIRCLTHPGQTVLDPFMGSGASGVGCKRLGRRYVGIEIMPEYFDVAKRRIESDEQTVMLI